MTFDKKLQEIKEHYQYYVDIDAHSTFLEDCGYLLSEVERLQSLVDEESEIKAAQLEFGEKIREAYTVLLRHMIHSEEKENIIKRLRDVDLKALQE